MGLVVNVFHFHTTEHGRKFRSLLHFLSNLFENENKILRQKEEDRGEKTINWVWGKKMVLFFFFLPQDLAWNTCLLLSTTTPTKNKYKAGLMWSPNKDTNTKLPVWPPSSSHTMFAASLLLPNKSPMEDLESLNSEWKSINALAFLINDVRYWNRDKLILLATVLYVC